ncbi:tyrosine recombinase XerC [Arthrobacter sp. SDTb3-6]|uniref:site-specific integrase n=1 Tax=Arthrobacter sp. SDTb3-6 TaxID=2713571 RepID=UPI00159D6B81|nr:site-specific integrase [Arthrobacter sp. SDTb3-6]NVM97672.1 site-specific integrase [Arthrobacter sp. SDTb3-6]
MPRPPLPIGSWGKITRSQDAKGGWVAKARVRDLDGVTRLVERAGKSGAAAERNLTQHLTERTVPVMDDLKPNSRLTLLWEMFEAHLISEHRASATMTRYRYVSTYIIKGLGNVRIQEATTQRLDGFIQALKTNHGASVAKSARVVLSGMFGLAVRYGATDRNPIRDVGTIKMESKAARALSIDELRGILDAMRHSPKVINPKNKLTPNQTLAQYCTAADLTDVVTMFAATGARISEVLGVRWSDIDFTAKTVNISGKVNRLPTAGMVRESFTKTKAGLRVLPLPDFAIAMLMARQLEADGNIHDVVFPSTSGNLRDPSGVSKQWRKVRTALGMGWVTSHTFRKTLATLLDGQGLSARIGADQLGHAQISMTQDVYMGRGTVHTEVAEALDRMIH